MAEIAVSFAVDLLLPLLREETNLLKGIHKEFADIKDELESIQAFLKDADRRAAAEGDNSSAGVKTWVKQVREAAFRIEDIIDEYMIHVGQQSNDSGCSFSLNKIVTLIKTLFPRHRIASEIQDIKSCVRGVKERSERYGFQVQLSFEQGSSSDRGNQNVTWHDPRMASLYIEEAEVVGFEGPRDELIGWLINGRAERTIISVVGMGGQGKTTLAKKVFDSKEVIGHFDCHAWITVSQSYTVEGLLRDMLHKFCKENKEAPPHGILEMDRDSLINEVRNYLQNKRYVTVFDDIWNTHFWDEIEYAVIDKKNGSRIFITTRKMDVVLSCKKSSFVEVHELQPLTEEKSLELFYKKAFRFDFNGCCPEDLKDISSEIVLKCDGLPLAIVTIGGLLSPKEKTKFECEKFIRNLSSELENNSHLFGITKILGFSYDDLPYYLKSCLLYFGIYPEDYEVKSKRLIRQWIAEGFVRNEKGKTSEEVAEQYLTELIGRSLVQVSSFTIDGKARKCRVHDLLREMILSKFKDLSFCQHIGKDDQSVSSGVSRRLSILSDSNGLIGNIQSSHVRSLLVFTDKGLPDYFVRRIPKKYKLLKVLDFEDDEQLYHFPKNLENLIHLKYLSFRGANILSGSLPKSIGELHNLETLDIRNTFICEIPKEISKLRKLRHLLGHNISLIQWKDGIGGMTSLQTLCGVKFDDGIVALGKLKQVRELGLTEVKTEHGSALCASINEMQHLEKLDIESDEVIDLHFISTPMLRDLHFKGKLNKLPGWVPELRNIVKLHLQWSNLTDDPLKSLQKMPNLLFLNMNMAYEGESLHFQDGVFQKLKELYITYFYNLNSIVIDRGALQSLKKLKLLEIPQLTTVPSGIQHLEKLELLDIYHMSSEFNESIALDEGQEHPIIEHVPLVRITNSSINEGTKTRIIHH